MKIRVWTASVVLLVCVIVSSAFAEDDKKPAMSPQEKAAMAAWMKSMTPGPEHKLLDGMVGTFTTKVISWMTPGAPPISSTGTSVNSWVLGGRDVEQKFDGSFMGQPFKGIGYTGYDNDKKQYWGTWVDNMSTGVMTSTGNTTDGGKIWKFQSTGTDPMTGKESKGEMVITVADHDHHKMEMWGPGPDGKSYKVMEISYSRKK